MIRIEREDEILEVEERLPLLPLRDVVVYPNMTVPLLVGREPSVHAVEEAVAGDRVLFATAQKRPDIVDPDIDDLYRLGTVVRILQLFKLPDGTMRVLVEGLARAKVKRLIQAESLFMARLDVLEDVPADNSQIEALKRSIENQFEEYCRLNRRISEDLYHTVSQIEDPQAFSFSVASHLQLKVADKQEVLEVDSVEDRLGMINQILRKELEIIKLERKIEGQVRNQVHKNQKEFYLNEQMKAIRKELGFQNEFAGELEELEEQIRKAGMPKEVREKADKELDRLSKMSFISPEATVLRTYLDWMVSVPWKKRTDDNLDLAEVKAIMDEDHYGLRKVKERILEYLAVVQLSGHFKSPILCFVGPPGVGKTSLGKSIARAMGRKFVRMSLGGVRDEAEIRGHRRTYIGSMPGRIIQAMKKAGAVNPLILLDEVDKLGMDHRGDPASALLEVLDPEQNNNFNDHYLEVDYDLSRVMFITTANYLPNIPAPLMDRMEVISLPGYLETEKLSIAKEFLLPKQLKACGLDGDDVELSDPAVRDIVTLYTREAGVRGLERQLGKVARKVARHKAEGKMKSKVRITPKSLAKYLGPAKFVESPLERTHRVGVANGLAWTEAGGDLMTIEVTTVPGKGTLNLTGKLGEVMKESGSAAMTYARRNAEKLGLNKWFFQDIDLHIHVPEGAIPKDGPSAGITMATALVSSLTGIPTLPDVAMTGEITLRGTVLPIGGLTEKAVAASRAGAKTVLIPAANEKDLVEIPAEIRKKLHFVPVSHMDQVLELALQKMPTPIEPAPGRPKNDGGSYAHH
ncbi:MAG: endopeptidase La [Candidatus Eisenbacteria bacterium]|uniref:Lon protease n=1 Tax=Eiseniibacteriota bacterium TaxID=2212470 RepID=A0A7Y2E9T5_UNCEI|nr:endopeptidase La [Candidatus Eisenbacteria bacterium]